MPEDKECTLLIKTRALLGATDLSYLDIYHATGLQPNWLSLLATARMRNPSVNRVQKLYEFLAQRRLAI